MGLIKAYPGIVLLQLLYLCSCCTEYYVKSEVESYKYWCGAWKAFRCTGYRTVTSLASKCCAGWEEDDCDLKIPEQNFTNLTTEQPVTEEIPEQNFTHLTTEQPVTEEIPEQNFTHLITEQPVTEEIPEQNFTNLTTEQPVTEGGPPLFVPRIKNISVSLNKPTFEGGTRNYTFLCGFQHSVGNEYLYMVSWYQNGDGMSVSDYGEDENDDKLLLTESTFISHGFTLGNTLSCDVRAYTVRDGLAGAPSSRSPEFFVGIELTDRNVVIQDGATGIIKVKPTIPIPCMFGDTCAVMLKATFSNKVMHGGCSDLALESRQCGVSLYSERPLDTVYEINVTPIENGQYQTVDGDYEVFLETHTTLDYGLWKYYSLPSIQVHIPRKKKRKSHFGKRCHSDNDPHMKTFDGRKYEMQKENAVYTLYQHKDRDAEIQIRLKRCNRGKALCNCGIAARVGQDVYKIDLCDTDSMFMNYVSCGDNVLKVKSDKEYKYKILLPYGTYAEVDVQFIYKSIFLGIRIQPSTQDSNGMSTGLCGSLDDDQGNDFQLRDHTPVSDELTFTNSWRVLDESLNMFSNLFDKTLLIPMPYRVCICRNATGKENGDQLTCEPNPVASCVQGKVTSADSCPPNTRFRRSIRRNPIVPKVKIYPNYAFSKRRKRETSELVWNKDNSEVFCIQYIKQSPVYSLCSEIPNVRTDEAIYNCALDLQITQDTVWANISVESMRSTCQAELYRNVSLRQTYDDGIPSVAEQIESIACISNCSLAGRCDTGQCICEEGLGGCDCSNDLNQPPLLQGILDNGLCDELELPCSAAYIFGHSFIDNENLTCKLSRFKLSADGDRKQLEDTVVAAEFDSFIEVKCPIPRERTKRSLENENGFVYGYTVYVSNDGRHYGDGKDIYVYNSECHSPVWNDEHVYFVMKNGYCFIDGYCLESGYTDNLDNCSVCDPQQDEFVWSVNLNNTDCELDEPQSPEAEGTNHYLWIIAVVGSVVIVAIAIALVLFVRFGNRERKVGSSQILDYTFKVKEVEAAYMILDQRQQTMPIKTEEEPGNMPVVAE